MSHHQTTPQLEHQQKIDELNRARAAFQELEIGSLEHKHKNLEFYQLAQKLKREGIVVQYNPGTDCYMLAAPEES
ncbi:hypothetical protein Krac_7915 [Ktedonobacter racemifer DSM 44963]|uniref:Uncharacterized protein n=1 Tax=Ktedonobacter racemifer DSM 44963 TaxID=485913 RepID=D6TLG0_KTERA|nr:hypothetical protein Krac_7915 [Ktedonobacter racemifer DSM 44963]